MYFFKVVLFAFNKIILQNICLSVCLFVLWHFLGLNDCFTNLQILYIYFNVVEKESVE